MPRLRVPRPSSLYATVRDLRAIALWPLLLRVAVLVTGVAAVLLAWPVRSLASLLTLAAVAVVPGLASALFVRSRWIVTFEVLLVVLVTVALSVTSGRPGWAAIVALACVLYLHHAAAAFSAALPLGTHVHPDAMVAFALRVAPVVAATVALGLIIWLIGRGVHGHVPAVVPLAGLLLAIGATLVPAVLLRRA